MTILVDDAIWPWRGRRWAHLVSDDHLDELHDLAQRIGMPYLSFQGDHYDVHEDLRLSAIALGAVPTPARQLVRALRTSGLRHKGAVETWRWAGTSILGQQTVAEALGAVGIDRADERDVAASALLELGASAELRHGARDGQRIVVAHRSDRIASTAGTGLEPVSSSLSIHRAVGERGMFVEVVISD